jgi:tetratricopeptide (TPR) repeat protein
MDEAIVQFQIALQIKPDYAEAFYNLGNAYFAQGHVDKAISHLEKAVEISPDYVDAHNNLGHILLAQGQLDKAIAHFKKAVEVNPDHTEAHYNLANALWRRGQIHEAIVQYQKALETEPHFVEAQNNLAWLLATCVEPSLRNGEKAVALAREANELSGGTNPLILHTLAAALAETGQFTDAQHAAQKAVELARAAGRQDLVDQFNSELKRYGMGLPWHEATVMDHAAKK